MATSRGVEDRAPRARAGSRPSRRIAGGSPVQSTTVEAGPPCAGPPSRMRSMASPSWAEDLAARRAPPARPRRWPRWSAAARRRGRARAGRAWSGTRRPIVGGAARERRRAAAVRAAAGRRRSGRPASRRRRGPSRPAVMTPISRRLGGVVEQQHDPLVRRPRFDLRTAARCRPACSSATAIP